MVLYLAEKKVLGEAIANALPGTSKEENSVIYKGNNAIAWCSGHLLTLYDPEDYDAKYKEWKISDLPIYFPDWKVKIPKENKRRVEQIGELLKKSNTVVNCGDTDEEGQLLVDEILRFFHYTGNVKRLDTANTTVEALKKALQRMKDNEECVNDGWSAYARMVSDKMFGINLSRFYTKSYNTLLTVGRVQTPTLGMVVNRDMEIESHKKVYYYTLHASVSVNGISFQMTYVPEKENPDLTDGKFLSDSFLKEVLSSLINQKGTFAVKKEKVKVATPLPFNLTELNTYCGKKWGYNPDKVMQITQTLRDEYAAITYNRSDCQYLSMEHHKEAPETTACAFENLGIGASVKESVDLKKVSRCFNDANITAHFAIIPTATNVDISKLSSEQKNVYDIICRYYLIQFMPECIKEKTNISMPVMINGKNEGKLEMTSSVIIQNGYYDFLGTVEKEDENKAATTLGAGTFDGQIGQCGIKQNETKPPKRYTQSTLYADMTKISKYVDDPEIKKLLLTKDKDKKGENGSIGTSATRAEIIKKLIKNGFLEERKEGKKGTEILVSTEKGRRFYQLLPDSIKKADTTALWWVVQEDIKNGSCKYNELPEKVLETVKVILSHETVKSELKDAFTKQSKPLCKCPNCSADILYGKFGAYCKGKCGFVIGKMFGVKLKEEQVISLCMNKKTSISGIKKKDGSGTYTAYAIPKGIEDFSYEKDGKVIRGKQLKCERSFK